MGVDIHNMEDITVILRKSCLNQVKAIVPKNLFNPVPVVSHWKLEGPLEKAKKVPLDRNQVTREAVGADQAASQDFVHYILDLK